MSATTADKPTPPNAKTSKAGKAQPPVEDTEAAEPAVVVEEADDGGRDEIERLDPSNGQVVLENGTLVAIQPLKMRQFLRLLRIVTRGASGVMDSLNMSTGQDNEAFVQQLLALVIIAIPEAENETIAFIQSMCAVDVDDPTNATDLELYTYLDNPELEEMVSIIEVIVAREGKDIQALGKRLGSMFRMADKMGQV